MKRSSVDVCQLHPPLGATCLDNPLDCYNAFYLVMPLMVHQWVTLRWLLIVPAMDSLLFLQHLSTVQKHRAKDSMTNVGSNVGSHSSLSQRWAEKFCFVFRSTVEFEAALCLSGTMPGLSSPLGNTQSLLEQPFVECQVMYSLCNKWKKTNPLEFICFIPYETNARELGMNKMIHTSGVQTF